MNLFISIRSEILKTKRTASFYLTLFAAAFSPLMSMLDLIVDGVEGDHRADIFNELFTTKFQMTCLLVFPFFIILVSTLLQQIEYRNNTWKQVLSAPQTKVSIFLSKFINIQLLIILFLVINFLLMLAGAVILHFKEPSLNVLNQPLNGYEILMTRVNSYLSLLALCAIQFWMGLRFRNFIIPIAVGIGLWFIGTILVMQNQSAIAAWFPYSFHVYGRFPQYKPEVNTVGWTSLAYTVIFLVIGFLDFSKKRMNA
jgi:lantibiotic transport system permease protein